MYCGFTFSLSNFTIHPCRGKNLPVNIYRSHGTLFAYVLDHTEALNEAILSFSCTKLYGRLYIHHENVSAVDVSESETKLTNQFRSTSQRDVRS